MIIQKPKLLLLSLTLLLPGAAPANLQDKPQGTVIGRQWDISPAQERAIKKGLAWLAKNQSPAGFWAGDVGYKIQNSYQVWNPKSAHVGVTSLALMAFLAAGNLPDRGKYGTQVKKGLDFVKSCVQDDGSIECNQTRMYSHAFATLFLAEIYGSTGDDKVRKKLQRAIRFIVNAQNNEGGWRYRPKADRSDMSVTVCQVMALRAARNVGIRVQSSVIRRAVSYVRSSRVTKRDMGYSMGNRGYRIAMGGFKYQREDRDSHTVQRASFPLTAAGVTTLLGAGLYDDPLVKAGLEYMDQFSGDLNDLAPGSRVGDLRNGYRPVIKTDRGHYFFFYGHYYAAQAHFIAGGHWWTKYFMEIRDLLIRDQNKKDGSWRCTCGPGTAFSTAMATLILEVPYQYLPIFQR